MSPPDRQELRRAIEADIREHHPLLSPAWTHEWVESLLASLDRLGFCVVPTGDADRKRNLLDEALTIIWNLVEADASYDCRFDHHGNCQEHGSSGEPGQCIVAYGAEFVTNVRESGASR